MIYIELLTTGRGDAAYYHMLGANHVKLRQAVIDAIKTIKNVELDVNKHFTVHDHEPDSSLSTQFTVVVIISPSSKLPAGLKFTGHHVAGIQLLIGEFLDDTFSKRYPKLSYDCRVVGLK